MKKFIIVFCACLSSILIRAQHVEYGTATWYGFNDNKPRRTANGELFKENGYTCAAVKDIPFNSILEITNEANGKKVRVRVNDRGGMINRKTGRLVDLTKVAFKQLSDLKKGVIKIKLKVIKNEKERRDSTTVRTN